MSRGVVCRGENGRGGGWGGKLIRLVGALATYAPQNGEKEETRLRPWNSNGRHFADPGTVSDGLDVPPGDGHIFGQPRLYSSHYAEISRAAAGRH